MQDASSAPFFFYIQAFFRFPEESTIHVFVFYTESVYWRTKEIPVSVVRNAVRYSMVLVCVIGVALPVAAADPDPKSVLAEAAAVLRSNDSGRLFANVSYRGKFQGSEEQLDTDYTIAFRRPDQVYIHVESVDQEMYVHANGTEYTNYIPYYQQYRVVEQTMTVQDLIVMSGSDLTGPVLRGIASLTREEPFADAFAPEALSYIAAEDVDGKRCDRVRFAAFNRTYDLWIESAPTRLIRRIEADMTPEETDYQAKYGIPFDFQVTATMTEWELGVDVDPLLAFAAPEGVEKVDMFMPPRQPYPAEALQDQPAPEFTLPLFGGGEMALAKEKGKVVVLDFWATWCVPCRTGLPVMKQIATEYADKGVSVYAVNLGDDPETVKSFVEQFDLAGLPVALDVDASVGSLYMADSIPLTVIVGKDGVVRIVHVGIPIDRAALEQATSMEDAERIQREGYSKALRAEIDALLAGETPVE